MSLKKPFPGILAFFIVLLTMPLGHAFMILMEKIFGQEYVYPAATVLGIFGVILLIIGLKKEKEITATLYGLFAGLCIWTGWIEFSYVWTAHHLGMQPLIENEEVVTKPEYLIMPSSIGFLLVIMLYLLFNRQINCLFFRWFQRNLSLKFIKREKQSLPRPLAMITAMEIITILWFFYIILLIVYDKKIFGDRHPATYIVFAGALLWSAYLIIRLLRKQNLAFAIRYAIPTVIIFWTAVEILGRWNIFKEIWIEPLKYTLEMIIFLVVFIVLILILLTERKSRQRAERESHGAGRGNV